MWAQDWSLSWTGLPVSAPETMPQGLGQSAETMRPGAWMVSLEFAATDERGAIGEAACQLQSGIRPADMGVSPAVLCMVSAGPSTLRA